uniref:Alpha/beta hydrolase fold-3 domain-containing protein n=1 Tax=Aegilops tauschii TaxID=37682 RepID=N1R3T9_AEGTA
MEKQLVVLVHRPTIRITFSLVSSNLLCLPLLQSCRAPKGKEQVGREPTDAAYRGEFERLWDVACGSQFGPDHPYINPATSPGEWSQLGCGHVLVTTAELCWFVNRARAYAEGIKACGWDGVVEFHETKGEEHVYFLFKSGCDNAVKELAVVADFVGRC